MPPQNNPLYNPIAGYVVPIAGFIVVRWDIKSGTSTVGYETKHGFVSMDDFMARQGFGGDKMIHRYDSNK